MINTSPLKPVQNNRPENLNLQPRPLQKHNALIGKLGKGVGEKRGEEGGEEDVVMASRKFTWLSPVLLPDVKELSAPLTLSMFLINKNPGSNSYSYRLTLIISGNFGDRQNYPLDDFVRLIFTSRT